MSSYINNNKQEKLANINQKNLNMHYVADENRYSQMPYKKLTHSKLQMIERKNQT